jgi:hypothetical protein
MMEIPLVTTGLNLKTSDQYPRTTAINGRVEDDY